MHVRQFPRTHRRPRRSFLRGWPCVLLVLLGSLRVGALEADQLLLITNANVPQGRKLAEYYANVRHVPDGRILELTLPTAEEISADVYDRQVVPVVRAFLREKGLERKVTCLVTFYGVPIRIANRVNSPADVQELAELQALLRDLPGQTEPIVQKLEQSTKEVAVGFTPLSGADLDAQLKRAEAAMRQLQKAAAQKSPVERQQMDRRMLPLIEPILGPMGLVQRLLARGGHVSVTRPTAGTQPATTQPAEIYARFRQELVSLEDRPFDADSRRDLRQLVRNNLGPFDYARLLHGQIDWFQTDATSAAFDSELSHLWWSYPRSRWLNNPLFYANRSPNAGTMVMVMRLDGPQSGTVGQIINQSLAAEEHGLKGRVVIDSRGLPVTDKDGKPDSYGRYDQGLRDLATLLQTKARTKLAITFDDRPEVMEAHSAKNVALYMGWYSVDRYVPACEFVPGAVGFHLASYTMVTLRREDPRCWARNLLDDGITATLGAVEEPYLQAFPAADDFFPLLLTGKLTLAEAYWKTVPWTSWRISMIGDPLYTPYKVNPVLAAEDLPSRLQPIFASPPSQAH